MILLAKVVRNFGGFAARMIANMNGMQLSVTGLVAEVVLLVLGKLLQTEIVFQ
jgi:hypothetical protein